MNTITRKLPSPIPRITGNEESIAHYSHNEREAIYLWRALPTYQNTVLPQDVLNALQLPLTFQKIDFGTITATDGKKSTYYLIGSWWDSRYVCRGLVKGRKNCRHHFLCNGQASTGTIQVAHYAEELQIDYPEIRSILNQIPFLNKISPPIPQKLS